MILFYSQRRVIQLETKGCQLLFRIHRRRAAATACRLLQRHRLLRGREFRFRLRFRRSFAIMYIYCGRRGRRVHLWLFFVDVSIRWKIHFGVQRRSTRRRQGCFTRRSTVSRHLHYFDIKKKIVLGASAEK